MQDRTVAAGYSGKPLVAKLGLLPGMTVALLDAPPDAEGLLVPRPEPLRLVHRLGGHRDAVLFFVTERARLAARLPAVIEAIAPGGMVWVIWPKRGGRRSTAVPTDLTEDVVREVALPTGLVDVKVCAVDEQWSGLKLVIRRALRQSSRTDR